MVVVATGVGGIEYVAGLELLEIGGEEKVDSEGGGSSTDGGGEEGEG